jgi:hypothetical protein
MAALTVSVIWCCRDVTVPLASTGAGSGGRRVSEGDTANHSEIMAPAAMVTPVTASSLITCIAGIMYPFVAPE